MDTMNCHVCGRYFPAAENTDDDPEGDRGMCRPCGGDPTTPEPTPKDSAEQRKAKTRKRNGWGLTTLLETRIPIIAQALNPENRAKFEALSYEEQLKVVEKLMRRGAII
jgi:hypothetical protein